jgi:hypothetical protein
LGSSVGFGPADAQGAEEKERVMPNDLRNRIPQRQPPKTATNSLDNFGRHG